MEKGRKKQSVNWDGRGRMGEMEEFETEMKGTLPLQSSEELDVPLAQRRAERRRHPQVARQVPPRRLLRRQPPPGGRWHHRRHQRPPRLLQVSIGCAIASHLKLEYILMSMRLQWPWAEAEGSEARQCCVRSRERRTRRRHLEKLWHAGKCK